LLSGVRADVAGIESNAAVSSVFAKQSEEFPLPAAHFNNHLIVKTVFGKQRLSQLREVMLEVGRAAPGVVIGGRVSEAVGVECGVKDKTAGSTERQQEISPSKLACLLSARTHHVLVDRHVPALEEDLWGRARTKWAKVLYHVPCIVDLHHSHVFAKPSWRDREGFHPTTFASLRTSANNTGGSWGSVGKAPSATFSSRCRYWAMVSTIVRTFTGSPDPILTGPVKWLLATAHRAEVTSSTWR